MADSRGGVTDALVATGQVPTGGYAGQAVSTRGGVAQAPSPYGSGFTSFAPRPQMAPQAGGFAPPPSNMVGGFARPPAPMMPGAGPAPTSGFAPPPSNLFAPPPMAGAPMPSNAMPARTPQPFRQMFSPGALANPGVGQVTRGGGRGF